MARTLAEDPSEQRVIDDVQRHGWHIVCVDEDEDGPAFAYSIGLFHTLKHPEIILFGLPIETMGSSINALGQAISSGAKFADGHESDQVLEDYLCIFRTVPFEAYPEYLGFAKWFYQSETFPVLQCIWPDTEHRYPWHPDCPVEVQRRQPMLGSALGWPFHEGKNRDSAEGAWRRYLDGQI